mmetsp:Transcript_88082/g.249633  ORF Transcript_88082/g.249633 Transcript_88082/m.249633 type:complete len:93 (-) Transcript_88082:98-376(-)
MAREAPIGRPTVWPRSQPGTRRGSSPCASRVSGDGEAWGYAPSPTQAFVNGQSPLAADQTELVSLFGAWVEASPSDGALPMDWNELVSLLGA